MRVKLRIFLLYILINVANMLEIFSQKFDIDCDLKNSNYLAWRAVQRAKTSSCKRVLNEQGCRINEINKHFKKIERRHFENKCPMINISGKDRALRISEFDFHKNMDKIVHDIVDSSTFNNLKTCKAQCLARNLNLTLFRKFDDVLECSCLLTNLTVDDFKQLAKEKNNQASYNLYQIQIARINTSLIKYVKRDMQTQLREYRELQTTKNLPRIVFLFTLASRNYRQVIRLFKSIYDDYHFYYFHVDEEAVYLRKKLEEFMAKVNDTRKNVKLADWAMHTIWSGPTLLQMHLKAFEDLLEMRKRDEGWNWDYVINLSETDYPTKSVEDFTLYLSQYTNGESFLNFASTTIYDVQVSPNMHYYFECENYVWKIGERDLPLGLQFQGGIDWFLLHQNFVNYVINSDDLYLKYLKEFFKFSVIPSESFFQTVILNSPFCTKQMAHNLRSAETNHNKGCHCEKLIDLCACSPSFFNELDLVKLKKRAKSYYFFARKFDPLFNMKIINFIDEEYIGKYPLDFKSLDSYWLNIYDRSVDSFDSLKFKDHLLFSVLMNATDKINGFMLKRLNSIYQYFSKDKLKGLVFNVDFVDKYNNIVNTLEIYFTNSFLGQFTPTIDFENSIVNIDIFPNNECLKRDHEYFFKHLMNIQVTSDFDSREIRGSNIINLIDDKTEFFFLMNFQRNLSRAIRFKNEWIDPKGRIINPIEEEFKKRIFFKDRFVKYNLYDIWDFQQYPDMTTNYTSSEVLAANLKSQKLRDQLLKDNGGEWSVRTIIEYEDGFTKDLNDHYNSNKKIIKESVALTLKFLVLPSTKFNYKKSFNALILNHWSLESICSNEKSRFTQNRCFKDSNWSSLYPDPKSDLKYGLKNRNRL